MTKSKIKAVIFDFDGTLLDTEKCYMQFWINTAKHFGYTMTKKQYLGLRSLRKDYLAKTLYKWYGKSVDYKTLESTMFQYRDAYFKNHKPKVKKGIKEALVWLKKNNILIAIATAGVKPLVFKQLKEAKLFNYFDYFVFPKDVKHGKPAPDIYIAACRQLNLKPNQCIAVEDCPNGVISAYKAKVNTVMIPDLSKPDKSITNLKIKIAKDGFELIKLIKA